MEEYILELFKKKDKNLTDDEVFTEIEKNKEVIEPKEVYEGVIYEGILRWISGILVCFWVSGLIFSLGGSMVHILLVLAIILFLVDMILGKKLT
ncbi:lmo0937 family membrane protein [Clostridium bowmanii]|nr:lmo0937 family membrane protein [Clostridium bowmanii]